MNARIIKETRALFPIFCATLAATIALSFLPTGDFTIGLQVFGYIFCSALLAAASLGNEFQLRTMPMLLAQPVARKTLWREKTVVLGFMLAVSYLVFCFRVPFREADAESRLLLVLVPFCALCATPCVTMAMKNTLKGALAGMGVPFAIFVLLACCASLTDRYFPFLLINRNHSDGLVQTIADNPLPYFAVVAGIYCAFYYWLGYRNFLGFEAVDAQEKEISLPRGVEVVLAPALGKLIPGYSSPMASLIRKELHLQRVSFLIAGIAIVLAAIESVVRAFYKTELTIGLLVLNVVICVLIVPLISTGIAVAEERSWGVAGWQQTLPPSRRKQWLVKLGVMFGTRGLLGVVLPYLMVAAGHGIFGFPAPSLPSAYFYGNIAFSLGYLVVLSVGLFASTATASTFRAITLTMILLAVAGTLVVAGARAIDVHPFQWSRTTIWLSVLQDVFGPMVHWVGHVLVLAIIGGLAYFNYRHGEPSLRRCWIQSALVTVLAAGFGVVYILLIAFMPGKN